MQPLILIGGGGHCRSCIDVIHAENKFRIRGIVDAKEPVGTLIDSYGILGNDELLPGLIKEGFYFLVTIGQLKNSVVRRSIFDQLRSGNALMATVVSPRALVSGNATIGEGSIIMHGAIVNAGATVGENNIINTMSLVEHDTSIGDHVHVSTGARVNGGCQIGSNTFIGSNAVISNNIAVGENVVIGAGGVVVRDIIKPGIYAGNPVKKIKDE